jgi:hypothetical protein
LSGPNSPGRSNMSIINYLKKIILKRHEKRKFLRIREYKLIKYRTSDNSSNIAFIRDYSEGGILFHSKKFISPGKILDIEIIFSERSDPLKGRAKVLRVKRLNIMRGFEIAVEFVQDDEELREIIKNRTDAILRNKKTKHD